MSILSKNKLPLLRLLFIIASVYVFFILDKKNIYKLDKPFILMSYLVLYGLLLYAQYYYGGERMKRVVFQTLLLTCVLLIGFVLLKTLAHI